jgi:hypothetical protein
MLRDRADVHKLQASGVQELWIDPSKGEDIAEQPPAAVIESGAAAPVPAFVKRHPSAGYNMLNNVECMPAVALDVCLHHRHRVAGRGRKMGPAKYRSLLDRGAMTATPDTSYTAEKF